MPIEQCRSRHQETRLRCERNRGHDGEHRTEPGPTRIATETNRIAAMVTWSTPTH